MPEHFERTRVSDQQDESACYYYCAKCCGPVWIEEPFQNLIFVGLISCGSCGTSGSAGLWMGWRCCSLLSPSHSCFQLGSLLTSLSHAGLLQGQECESLWWHYGWMESSRVIMSQRNTIHSNQKVRNLQSSPSILNQFKVIYDDVIKATTFFVDVFHQSESSPENSLYLSLDIIIWIQPKPMTLHIPWPGSSHWPLTTSSASLPSWFPSQ